MRELSIIQMEEIEGGKMAAYVDAFCSSFGISCLIGGGILLTVPGMQVFAIGCGGWTIGRSAGLI